MFSLPIRCSVSTAFIPTVWEAAAHQWRRVWLEAVGNTEAFSFPLTPPRFDCWHEGGNLIIPISVPTVDMLIDTVGVTVRNSVKNSFKLCLCWRWISCFVIHHHSIKSVVPRFVNERTMQVNTLYILFPWISICIFWPFCVWMTPDRLSEFQQLLTGMSKTVQPDGVTKVSFPTQAIYQTHLFFEHINIVGHGESNDLFLNVCRRPKCAWRTNSNVFLCFPPLIRCVRQTVSQGPFEAPVAMPADDTCRTSKSGFSKRQAEKGITHPAQLQ